MSNPTEAETPTTEDVRDSYTVAWAGWDTTARYDMEAYAEFDRWLAEHDAKVLRDAAQRVRLDAERDECALHDVMHVTELPHLSRVMLNGVTRAAERLRALARPVVEGDNQ